jgi:hypothetical protein
MFRTRRTILPLTCRFTPSPHRENTDPVKNIESLSTHDRLSTVYHLLGVSFMTCAKSNLCTALTTQNTKEKNCIIPHAQHTIAIRDKCFNWNISVIGHKRGAVGFPKHNCQRQLKILYSLSVTASDRVHEKLAIVQLHLLRNPCTQQPATGLHLNSVHALSSYFFKIHFNIILPYKPRNSKQYVKVFYLPTDAQ